MRKSLVLVMLLWIAVSMSPAAMTVSMGDMHMHDITIQYRQLSGTCNWKMKVSINDGAKIVHIPSEITCNPIGVRS